MGSQDLWGNWGWGGSKCYNDTKTSWGGCWGGSSTNFWEQEPGKYSPCPAGSYKQYPGEACCKCAPT